MPDISDAVAGPEEAIRRQTRFFVLGEHELNLLDEIRVCFSRAPKLELLALAFPDVQTTHYCCEGRLWGRDPKISGDSAWNLDSNHLMNCLCVRQSYFFRQPVFLPVFQLCVI